MLWDKRQWINVTRVRESFTPTEIGANLQYSAKFFDPKNVFVGLMLPIKDGSRENRWCKGDSRRIGAGWLAGI